MDLKLEDLYVQCDECEGQGRIEGPPPQQSNQGNFGRHEVWREGPCEKCHGTGGKLTENGEVLLQFMQVLKRRHQL